MNPTHEYCLTELRSFFSDRRVCRESYEVLVHLAVRLAAVGHAVTVLALIERASEKETLVHLAGGLRAYLGQPGFVTEQAGEIVAKIRSATVEFAFDRARTQARAMAEAHDHEAAFVEAAA